MFVVMTVLLVPLIKQINNIALYVRDDAGSKAL